MAIEFVTTFLALYLTLVGGLFALLQGLGSLIATHWASKHSQCVARLHGTYSCDGQSQTNILEKLAFKNVEIKTKRLRGVIHTEVQGQIAGKKVRGLYDLEPSEYRRISEGNHEK